LRKAAAAWKLSARVPFVNQRI